MPAAWERQSITKIQFKDREQPPVEKNYTDLDKVPSELFRLDWFVTILRTLLNLLHVKMNLLKNIITLSEINITKDKNSRLLTMEKK